MSMFAYILPEQSETAPNALEPELSLNPPHAWFVVYSVDLEDREFVGEIVVIGKHPVLWVKQDAVRSTLRFFAEIPLDVALRWPNYEDFRENSDD